MRIPLRQPEALQSSLDEAITPPGLCFIHGRVHRRQEGVSVDIALFGNDTTDACASVYSLAVQRYRLLELRQ